MISKHPPSGGLVWLRLSRALPRFLLSAGAFFVFIALVGLVFGQRYLTPSQDTRSSANNPTGSVIVSFTPSQTTVSPGQPISFVGSITTQGVQTDGIQLVLLLPKSAVTSPTIALRPNTGLQQVVNRVIDQGTVYELQFMAVPQTIGQSFSTTQVIPILDISATANQSGSYNLTADQARSLSTRHGSNPVVDELRPINAVPFAVSGTMPAQTPTPPNTATPTPTPSGPLVCDVSVPLGAAPSVQWMDNNQIQLRWLDAPTATGFRIYLISDGTPLAGQPYVIWNVLENNAAVSEDAQFSPIETDLIKDSINPTPNAQGIDEYTWHMPTTAITDRTGATVNGRNYYRFLVYAYKGNENCHKQAAIGRAIRPLVTVVMNPTLTPTVTLSPATTSASLNMSFTLQGLTRQGVTIKTTIYLREHNPMLERPTPNRVYPFDANFVSDQQGVLRLANPLQLIGVPVAASGTQYDILVKTPVSLRKTLGNMRIMRGNNQTPVSWQSPPVKVGDFVQAPPTEWNTLNMLDISALLSQYTRLQTPVTVGNQQYDVTHDGKIDIMDVAIVLSNYTQLSIQGD